MQIITRDGRTRDGDTLEDGERIRVGMTFMDSAQRAVANSFRSTKSLVVDGYGNSDLYALRRPGPRFPTQRTTTDARQAAYDATNKADEEAYRKPAGSYPLSAGEGNVCTINGQPGVLTRSGEWLVCTPSNAQPTRQDARPPPLVEDREAVLREVQLRDENAWRKGNQ